MSLKKKLLIITPYMPYPLNGGGQIAQFEINDSIRQNLDITLIFPVRSENIEDFKTLTSKWPDIVFRPYHPSRYQHFRYLALKTWNHGFCFRFKVVLDRLLGLRKDADANDEAVIKSTLVYKSDTVDPGLVSHILNEISKTNFDIVQIEFSDLLPLIRFLPKHIKRIFVHHELRFARDYSELKILSSPYPLLEKLWARNKSIEINNLQQYDLVIALSNEDKSKLAPYLGDEKILVSPFVIRARATQLQPFVFGNKLIFIGGQGHFPNKDGLCWFVTTCWKKLRESFPNLQLHVVGEWDLQSIEWHKEYSGITFLGYVDNLEEACANGISIIPIRIGSGIRMKIIETINIGIPFVTTTIGVEGLNFQNERDCIISDTPEGFSESISRIILTQELGPRLSSNAKSTLETEYSYDKIIEKRLSAYKGIK